MSGTRFAQGLVALMGVFYTATSVAQLFAPQWFFEHIGYFPPFNRHYVGDLGAFTMAMGVGLLFAAREPSAHRGLIGVVALGSIIHVLNHLYDDWLNAGLSLTQTVPLALLALVMVMVWWRLRTQPQT